MLFCMKDQEISVTFSLDVYLKWLMEKLKTFYMNTVAIYIHVMNLTNDQKYLLLNGSS